MRRSEKPRKLGFILVLSARLFTTKRQITVLPAPIPEMIFKKNDLIIAPTTSSKLVVGLVDEMYEFGSDDPDEYDSYIVGYDRPYIHPYHGGGSGASKVNLISRPCKKQ